MHCRLLGVSCELDGRALGFVGGSARHFELGPIAFGLIKRGTPVEATLSVDGIAAAQEPWWIPTSAFTYARPSNTEPSRLPKPTCT